MKKLFLLIHVLLILGVQVYSQEIRRELISTAGEFYTTSNGSLAWSIGQVAVQTHEKGDFVLSQGFHQSNLIVTAIKDSEKEDLNVKAFPNPVRYKLSIQTESLKNKKIFLELYDIHGSLLLKKKIKTSPITISLANYSPGEYILRIIKNNKPVKSYKIIKQ